MVTRLSWVRGVVTALPTAGAVGEQEPADAAGDRGRVEHDHPTGAAATATALPTQPTLPFGARRVDGPVELDRGLRHERDRTATTAARAWHGRSGSRVPGR